VSVFHGQSFSNTRLSGRPTRRRRTERRGRSSIISGLPPFITVGVGSRWQRSSKLKNLLPRLPLNLIRTRQTKLKNRNHLLSHYMISTFLPLTSTLILWHQQIMRLSPPAYLMKLGKDLRSSLMMRLELLNSGMILPCSIG
jgi:hypothetical protein